MRRKRPPNRWALIRQIATDLTPVIYLLTALVALCRALGIL
jgi:hypothetical protein